MPTDFDVFGFKDQTPQRDATASPARLHRVGRIFCPGTLVDHRTGLAGEGLGASESPCVTCGAFSAIRRGLRLIWLRLQLRRGRWILLLTP